jgi:RNA polymerase sigma-70 factor, ECF subfamily
MAGPEDITRLLTEWSGGDESALHKLLPLIYEELRHLASAYMRHERDGHMLQTTALVHEAYLKLVHSPNANCENRTRFFALAAQVMRHILVDYARGQLRAKRGKGHSPVELSDVAVISDGRAEEIVAVNTALDKLAAMDARKGRVFELRYFGGMSVEEAAGALNVSPVTVARDWRMAKAWLRREIAPESGNAG